MTTICNNNIYTHTPQQSAADWSAGQTLEVFLVMIKSNTAVFVVVSHMRAGLVRNSKILNLILLIILIIRSRVT